jgi:murein DD-endopeptidase MepM/ murein hydrolase activator NlpD
MEAENLNVKDVERRLTNIVRSLMPKFLSEARETAKETAKIAKDLKAFDRGSGTNFLSNALGKIDGLGNRMAGAGQVGGSLAKPGVGLMEFVGAAEGYASGMSTFMPDTAATLQRASTYYNASLTNGPRQSRLGVQQATFGILNQMGAITSLGSDAAVANILGSQGMSVNRGVYGQTVTAVGNAARYLNMDNARAATAISGLTSGQGASNMLRNFGIYTSDLKTGKEKTQGQIFEELAGRLTAGRPGASVEETMDSIRRGNLGETIANSGLSEDQQTLFKQYMINRAAGKKMDLSDQDAMKSIMDEAKASGNDNPLTGMMNLETAATGALQKAEGSYITGINGATSALAALQQVSGGLASTLLGVGNAFMKTMLSDNTVQGMSTMVKSSLDLMSSGMKAVQSTTVMGSNPQMAIGGGVAIVGGTAMLGGIAAQIGVGAVAGGGGSGEGDNAMSNLTSSVLNAQTSGSIATGGKSKVAKPYVGEVLTKYGEASRDDKGNIIKANHDGIDYKGTEGTTVTAVADGTVTEVKDDAGTYTAAELHAGRYGKNSYGNFVKIQHEDKVVNGKSKTQHTVYSHLKDVFVKKNAKVKKGDPIGTLGRTGQAYSPHLHFEYLIDGKTSNPSNFKEYTDKSLATTKTSGSGMDAGALAQANSMATALQGLFSGNIDQMKAGLNSLAGLLNIDASKYGVAGSNDGFGTGSTSTSSGTNSSGNPVTNNTTINVNIPNATPDEAKKFAELVAQYHDQNTLTSNMGRF